MHLFSIVGELTSPGGQPHPGMQLIGHATGPFLHPGSHGLHPGIPPNPGIPSGIPGKYITRSPIQVLAA